MLTLQGVPYVNRFNLRFLTKQRVKPVEALPETQELAALVVWCTWGILAMAAFVLVGTCASNVPWFDEWEVAIPWLTEHVPITGQWLWEFLGESRWPLTKLVYLALFKFFAGDFRGPMFFNTALLVLLSFALLWTARRLRGWTSWTDLFLPLALLHWGHYQNLLWSMQVVYLVPIALSLTLLLIALCQGTRLSLGAACLASVCVLALPLCGGWGIIFALPFMLWLGGCGIGRWRSASPTGKRDGSVMLAGAVTAQVIIGLYFQGYEARTTHVYVPRDLASFVEGVLQFLTMAFGPAAVSLWPVSGYVVGGLLLSTLILVGVAVLLRTGAERLRALGLLCFMIAVLGHALGVGWGRSGWGPAAGFVPRYTTLAVLGLCGTYFVWELYGPRTLRGWVQSALLILMVFLLPQNTSHSLRQALEHKAQMAAYEADLQAGEPSFRLARRYAPYLVWLGSEDLLAERTQMLKAARIGNFKYLAPDPAFDAVPLNLEPHASSGVVWGKYTHVATVTRRGAYLEFALPQPQYVAGVQVSISYLRDLARNPQFRLLWRKPNQPDFARGQRSANLAGQGFTIKGLTVREPCEATWELLELPDEQTVLIWVDAVIDRLRLYPDDMSCEDADLVPDWVLEQLRLFSFDRERAYPVGSAFAERKEFRTYAFQLSDIALLIPQ